EAAKRERREAGGNEDERRHAERGHGVVLPCFGYEDDRAGFTHANCVKKDTPPLNPLCRPCDTGPRSDMAKALRPATAAFWQAYLATAADPAEAQRRFWETFSIGDSPESAAEGADLILRGEKTTTSSLLSEFKARGEPVPTPGALSILEGG